MKYFFLGYKQIHKRFGEALAQRSWTPSKQKGKVNSICILTFGRKKRMHACLLLQKMYGGAELLFPLIPFDPYHAPPICPKWRKCLSGVKTLSRRLVPSAEHPQNLKSDKMPIFAIISTLVQNWINLC